MICSNVPKIWRVIFERKDVMVALDEHLVTVELWKNVSSLPVNIHITKMVHLILRTNHTIPVVNHCIVHLVCIIPWTQLRAIRPKKSTHSLVGKMRIRNNKNVLHNLLLCESARKELNPRPFAYKATALTN
jgi:hypothetical protein